MENTTTELRRLPLRIAGVIGMASALIYIAGVAGAEDTSQVPAAVAWFLVIMVAGATAWLADRSSKYGRNMAIGAAGVFFIVGVLSSTVFAVIYLIATVMTVLGFAGTSREGTPSDT